METRVCVSVCLRYVGTHLPTGDKDLATTGLLKDLHIVLELKAELDLG